MRNYLIIHMIILFGCTQSDNINSVAVTKNGVLSDLDNNGYSLTVKRSWGNITVSDIQLIDIDDNKHTMLVKGKFKNTEGWIYIMDIDPFDKLYGPYNEEEFKIRSKELAIEGKFKLSKPEIYF